MSIGENIRRLREAHGLSQMQLGQIAGVTDKAVSSWERGEKVPRLGAVDRMARHFGLSRSVILAEDPPVLPEGALPLPHRSLVPVVGAVRAGYGLPAFEEREGCDYAEVKNPSEYFYLRVTGDSMAPAILEGDLALIHLQPDVESGEIAVVLLEDDEGTLKRVIKRPGALILQPLNPDYPPLLLSDEALAHVRIAGKLMEIKRKF